MTSPLLLSTLLPDVLHAIVRLSCSDMHSKEADAAAAAQDTATALRLTCRTLKAAVDATVAQLDIRASSSADLAQAAALFPGLQHALGCTYYTDSQLWLHGTITTVRVETPPAGLHRIHLRAPAGSTTIIVLPEHMSCLTDIRSYTS